MPFLFIASFKRSQNSAIFEKSTAQPFWLKLPFIKLLQIGSVCSVFEKQTMYTYIIHVFRQKIKSFFKKLLYFLQKAIDKSLFMCYNWFRHIELVGKTEPQTTVK